MVHFVLRIGVAQVNLVMWLKISLGPCEARCYVRRNDGGYERRRGGPVGPLYLTVGHRVKLGGNELGKIFSTSKFREKTMSGL